MSTPSKDSSNSKSILLSDAEEARRHAYKKAQALVDREIVNSDTKAPLSSHAAISWMHYIAGSEYTIPDKLKAKLQRRKAAGLPWKFYQFTNATQRAELLARNNISASYNSLRPIVSPNGGFRSPNDEVVGIVFEYGTRKKNLNPAGYRSLRAFMPTESRLSGEADVWWVLSFAAFCVAAGVGLWHPLLGIALGVILVTLFIAGHFAHRTYLSPDDMDALLHAASRSDAEYSSRELALLDLTKRAASETMNSYAWKIGYMSDQSLDWNPALKATDIVENVQTLQRLREATERDPSPGFLETHSYEELFTAVTAQVVDYVALAELSVTLSEDLSAQESSSKRSPSNIARAALRIAALSELQREADRDWTTRIAAHSWALRTVR